MGNLIAGIVSFPTIGSGKFWFIDVGWISNIIYWLFNAMSAMPYILTIVFFVIIIRLVMLPLDFANKYFTKRNQAQIAKLKPEEDALKEQYANSADPMAFNRAKQDLYRKNGAGMGGFCLISILYMFLTLMIFVSVAGAMNEIAHFNVNKQFIHMRDTVYNKYLDEDGTFTATEENPEKQEQFNAEIWTAYEESRVSFLWIVNIWQPDTFWNPSVAEFGTFKNTVINTEDSIFGETYIKQHFGEDIYDETHVKTYYGETIYNAEKAETEKPWNELTETEQNGKWNAQTETRKTELTTAHINATKDKYSEVIQTQYETMFGHVKTKERSWNGVLILVILSGAVTFFTTVINTRIMASKKKDDPKKETEAQYSMRKVKNMDEAKMPTIDPQMMNKIMKFILPAIMIFFAIQYTSAFAIYMIVTSVVSTGLTWALNRPIDALIKWQEKRRANRGGDTDKPDMNTINPHAKYFKKKR